jgi:hypothetical protein
VPPEAFERLCEVAALRAAALAFDDASPPLAAGDDGARRGLARLTCSGCRCRWVSGGRGQGKKIELSRMQNICLYLTHVLKLDSPFYNKIGKF